MALAYGFIKAKMTSLPRLQAKAMQNETQYHLHFSLDVGGADWDTAVNVGTNNAADLLKYKIAEGFPHPVTGTLRMAPAGAADLTGTAVLPALDFLRSSILEGTGDWRNSDVLDGSGAQEPVATLSRHLSDAFGKGSDVYIFGRFYSEGNGVHDVHMNQGSRGRFVHREGNDANDHNDIWQDGAVLIDAGDAGWVAYFSAFTQQTVPTDELGNPLPGGHTI